MAAVSDGSKQRSLGGGALVSSLFFLLLSSSSFGQLLDLPSLARKVQPSVLLILEKGPSGEATAVGSGFLVSSDGKLVTNDHGSKGAEELSAQAANGRIYRVVGILARDARQDRELLQLAAKDLPFLRLSSPVSVHDEEPVAIVPSRFAGQNGISPGKASIARGFPSPARLRVITTAVSRLYPGSPVVGSDGQVLGVATAKAARPKSGSLVIPVSAIGVLSIRSGVETFQGVGGPAPQPPQRPTASERTALQKAPTPPETGQEARSLAPPSSANAGGREGVAWELLQHRDYAKAAEAFEQELRRGSANARTWLGYGLAKRGLGQAEEASTIFRQAARLSPSSAKVWCELGEVDLQLKRYPEAANSFGQAVQIRPSNARAWLGVAAANLGMQKRGEALAALDRVRDLDMADGELWRTAGKIYLGLGRREEAATAFQRAVDLTPKDPRAWLELGLVSVDLGRTERVQEILPNLLALDREMGMKLVEALEKR